MTVDNRKVEAMVIQQTLDHISTLPDALLCEILSLLSADEAARTSILAKRWVDLWKYVPHLNFDPKRMVNSSEQVELHHEFLSHQLGIHNHTVLRVREELQRAVLHIGDVLDSHRSPLIGCRIIHFPESCRNGQVDRWIHKLVTQKAIRELSLICDDSYPFEQHYTEWIRTPSALQLKFSEGILACPSLSSLEMRNYKLESFSGFHGAHNLRTLKLESVCLNDESLEGIASACEFLEEFRVIYCIGFRSFKLHHQNLKFLELTNLAAVEVDVSAPGLEVFKINSVLCPGRNFMVNAPNVRVLHVRPWGISPYRGYPFARFFEETAFRTAGLLEYCCGLLEREHGDKEHQTNLLENMQTLTLNVDLNDIREVVVLSFILRVSLHLQKLQITIKCNDEKFLEDLNPNPLPYPKSMFWDKRELCDCVTFGLRQVTIKGFKGKELELEFVKYLVTKATAIEKITIQCDPCCTMEGAIAAMGLLSLPKSSINVSIDLKPGSKSGTYEHWLSRLKQPYS